MTPEIKITASDMVKIAKSHIKSGGIGPKKVKDSSVNKEIDRVSITKKSARKLTQAF